MAAAETQNGGISILLLDDSAPLRSLLVELLEEIASVDRIVQVEDVSSTLRAFEQNRFDVAILDLNIPGADGIRNGMDLARIIKKRHPETKVALLTALANTVDRDASIDAGLDGFYDKREFEALLTWVAESAQPG